MAKKRRSPKQRANDKRLGRMAKKRKTTTRKRRTTRKGMLTLSRKRAYAAGPTRKVKRTNGYTLTRKSRVRKASAGSEWNF